MVFQTSLASFHPAPRNQSELSKQKIIHLLNSDWLRGTQDELLASKCLKYRWCHQRQQNQMDKQTDTNKHTHTDTHTQWTETRLMPEWQLPAVTVRGSDWRSKTEMNIRLTDRKQASPSMEVEAVQVNCKEIKCLLLLLPACACACKCSLLNFHLIFSKCPFRHPFTRPSKIRIVPSIRMSNSLKSLSTQRICNLVEPRPSPTVSTRLYGNIPKTVYLWTP